MEKNLVNSTQHPEENQDSLLAEMVLKNALLDFRRNEILKEIDQSLKTRNKEQFLRLTEELKKIS
ncbi:IDEAL domain-containing protein [Neobacillus sp. SM06]|uniref:IDEAL domain-containing protein n=1 Tax=Neobacillus sp. SM06 TaxID=3422492 RepID=UPI003D292D60